MKPIYRLSTTYQNNRLFKAHSGWFHFLRLLVWLAIGSGLRFTHLVAKPPWNDEFATVVFSLGNSFRTVPINQAIALDVLGSAKEVMMHCNDE